MDVTTLPFDQYQRYRIGAALADLFRPAGREAPLRVLDVGGFFRRLDRRVIYPIALFLPNDRTVTVDLVHHTPAERDGSTRQREYVEASGAHLPFPDASFDLVLSCDTLEHVPREQRPAFLGELARVSADGLMVAAPFWEPEVEWAEKLVLEYIRGEFGYDQPQLAEHRTNGLPGKDEMRAWLDAQEMTYVDFPFGCLERWTTMMLLKSHLFARPHLDDFHVLVDQYYNLNLFDADQRVPAYRHFFVASKRKAHDALLRATGERVPRPPAGVDTASRLMDGLLEIARLASNWEPPQEPDLPSPELRRLRGIVARTLPPLKVAPRPAVRVTATPQDGVLLVSPDVVAPVMAGPGIRYWELARALARRGLRVTLATPNAEPLATDELTVQPLTHRSQAASLAAQHRVTVVQGFALVNYPDLARTCLECGGHLVVDLYGPFHLETLEAQSAAPLAERAGGYLYSLGVLGEQVRLADFFLCASERQRDYWLGVLTGHYRVNPHVRADDPDLRRLIDVVPFGLSPRPRTPGRPVLRGVHPALSPGDKILLWTGGLWDWLDPFSLIRALAQMAEERPHVKLFVARYPQGRGPMPRWQTLDRAIALSRQLGLLERSIFFIPWMAYEQWLDALAEADLAVSLHADSSLEARFAFRTRHLDCLAAGLPMVVSKGDVLSDLIAERGLGRVVEPGDVSGLVAALSALLDEPDAKRARAENFGRVQQQFAWERAVEPLARYCASPWRAADLASGQYTPWLSTAWEQIVQNANGADRALADCRAQLAAREQTIDAIMRGRVMRLMLGLQRRLRRWRRK